MAEAGKHLGKISGLAACYSKSTLNGRPYDEIYKGILAGENYRYNEMMRRGGILCEFGHPSQYTADFERTETDPEKAAVLITKMKEAEDGKIYADEAIILDTPAGRIFNAIRPFYKFGLSSRGSYEADPNSDEGPDGWNQDSYVFKGFDIVALPANEGSEISALESFKGTKPKKGKRPKFKSAREALDINQIADAASVEPEEVTAELDKIFNEDGDIEPAELVTLKEFMEQEKKANVPQDQSNILLDLHKVLIDKSALEKDIQKLLFEKAEADAALLALQEQNEQLSKIKDEAQAQIEFYRRNREEIQEMIDGLLATHTGFVEQSDLEIEREKEHSKSLAARVAGLEKEVLDAKGEAELLFNQAQRAEEAESNLASAREELKSLKSANEQLKRSVKEQIENNKKAVESITAANAKASKFEQIARQQASEAAAAVEALVGTYSTLYGIDKAQLQAKVGKKATVATIRSAAEGLSKDAVRLSAFATVPQNVGRVVATSTAPTFSAVDDIDKELYAGLEYDSRIGEK